ncbi:hypothetical protein JYU04_02425 [Dehalococcoides mccartyi]|nr:hypothetical protein [Dehalococcoides mccartyi]
MSLRGIGRVAGILGATLTFFVGLISVVLGLVDSTTEQSGNSLIVRGIMLVGLSMVAGYGASLSSRRPGQAAVLFIGVAVLGSVVAFRSFWIAAAVLAVAAFINYSSKDR